MKTTTKFIKLSVLSTSFCLLLTPESQAITIGYFNNPTFTDSFLANNLREVLEDGGENTITEFDSLDASAWQTIADNNQIIAIPTIDNLSLADSLSPETEAVIRNYVAGGGGFFMAGEVLEVIPVFNNVFDFSFNDDFWSESTELTQQAQGTIFDDAPISLGSPFQTTTMALDSLPVDSIVFYDNSLNSPSDRQNSTSVFATSFGLGHIAFNGYDYGQSENDTGWSEVTNLTVQFITKEQSESVPESSTIFGLFGTLILGLLSSFIKFN
ncbi:MAG: hypothetical protein AB4057_23555 [Crocosphaera sp.]